MVSAGIRGGSGSRVERAGRGRAALVLLAMLAAQLVAGAAPPAAAASIQVVYDPDAPGAVDPCADDTYINDEGLIRQGPLRACQGGVDRTPELEAIVEAAAAHYAGIFPDAHEVTISFSWLGPWTAPDAKVLERDDSGRPTAGRIRIPADLGYFYDPTPAVDEEFDMRPRLYRTTHPAEQAAAFDGSPPEVLEVAYVGRQKESLAADLVTIVLHEMAHALGLSGGPTVPTVGPDSACDGANDPFFRPSPDLVGGATMGIKAFDNDEPAQQCVHLELGGIQECKTDPEHTVGGDPDEASTVPGFTLWECASHQALVWTGRLPLARVRPGVVDLLALRGAGGWQMLDLPRAYTAVPGDWAAPSTWIGNRVPDASDDVYIVNEVAGTKVWDIPAAGASAANVYVSDQNTLRVVGAPLAVADHVRVAGPGSTAGPLRLPDDGDSGDDDVVATVLTRIQVGTAAGATGTLQAVRGTTEPGAALQLYPDSQAVIGTLENDGALVGAGTVEILSRLDSTGRIRAAGGTLVVATPPPPDDALAFELPVLDLRGEIRAVDGDVVVDGIVSPTVKSDIVVGGGRSLTFTHGWTQVSSPPQAHLLLDGETAEARVSGASALDNLVEVRGLGRFTHTTTFGPWTRLAMSIGGTAPGADHSQLTVEQSAHLDGELHVAFTNGFTPAPLDSFVLLRYLSRTGEFDQVVLPPLDGGLAFLVLYEEEQLRLLVGFEGADPGQPDCHGDAVAHQTQMHGSIKKAADFHGYPSVKQFQDAMKAFCAAA